MTGDARNILEPLMTDFVRTFNDGDFDRMHKLYHKNAVMVEKDKSVLWGQKDIVASLLQMATDCGKTRMEISNSKYDGVGDFLNVTTDFAFHTEKSPDNMACASETLQNAHYFGISPILFDESCISVLDRHILPLCHKIHQLCICYCSLEYIRVFPPDARNILEPLMTDFVRTFNDGDFDRMHGLYHKNAVMVEKDKSVMWGQKDIIDSLLQMAADCGKIRMKTGVLHGSFIQIWRRDGNSYSIYHDEYEKF